MTLRCRFGFHAWYVLRRQEVPAPLSPGYSFTILDRVCLRCEKRDDKIGQRERIAAEMKARAKEIVRFEPTTEPAACVNFVATLPASIGDLLSALPEHIKAPATVAMERSLHTVAAIEGQYDRQEIDIDEMIRRLDAVWRQWSGEMVEIRARVKG